jgi:hypothetical protein
MIVVDNALYDRLAGDATLTALLSVYRGNPAIFTEVPIPPNARLPYIAIPEPLDDEAGIFDTKTAFGRRWQREILCYAQDTAPVETIAARVVQLFERQAAALTIVGYAPMVCRTVGPIVTPTDDTLQGRAVRVIIEATTD